MEVAIAVSQRVIYPNEDEVQRIMKSVIDTVVVQCNEGKKFADAVDQAKYCLAESLKDDSIAASPEQIESALREFDGRVCEALGEKNKPVIKKNVGREVSIAIIVALSFSVIILLVATFLNANKTSHEGVISSVPKDKTTIVVESVVSYEEQEKIQEKRDRELFLSAPNRGWSDDGIKSFNLRLELQSLKSDLESGVSVAFIHIPSDYKNKENVWKRPVYKTVVNSMLSVLSIKEAYEFRDLLYSSSFNNADMLIKAEAFLKGVISFRISSLMGIVDLHRYGSGFDELVSDLKISSWVLIRFDVNKKLASEFFDQLDWSMRYIDQFPEDKALQKVRKVILENFDL